MPGNDVTSKKFARFNIEEFLESLGFLHVALILSFIGFVAYGQAISYPFVHDDVVSIQQNTATDIHWSLTSIFQVSHKEGMLPYYRPFMGVIYSLQFIFLGVKNPSTYHLVNIILHILNSLLAYILAKLILQKKPVSFCLALLFLVHPIQSEAVTAIAGITNTVYSLFCFLSFILYILSAKKPHGRWSLILYGVALVLFLLALFTKEPAVVLPALLILYEACFSIASKGSLGKTALRLSGFIVVALGYLAFRKMMLGTVIFGFLGNQGELGLRLLSIPQTLLTYLSIIIFPVHLRYYRNADILQPFVLPTVALIIVVMMIVFLIYRAAPQTRRGLIFGLGWFFIALIPTLNILPLVIEYSYIFTSEHFLYFPLFGFAFFFLRGTEHFCVMRFKDSGKKIFIGGILAISFIFTAATIKQNTYWRGEAPLFERTLSFEKHLGRVRILLAKAYYNRQEFDKALVEYSKALRIMEGYALQAKKTDVAYKFYTGFIKGIHFDLAHCYEMKGAWDIALAEYQKAIDIDSNDYVLYNNRGTIFLRLGRVDEAAAHFGKAIALNPRHTMALNNLAFCYIQKGKLSEAESLLRQALKIDQNFVSARQNLEILLRSKEAVVRQK